MYQKFEQLVKARGISTYRVAKRKGNVVAASRGKT
jgi:hypothetical protein